MIELPAVALDRARHVALGRGHVLGVRRPFHQGDVDGLLLGGTPLVHGRHRLVHLLAGGIDLGLHHPEAADGGLLVSLRPLERPLGDVEAVLGGGHLPGEVQHGVVEVIEAGLDVGDLGQQDALLGRRLADQAPAARRTRACRADMVVVVVAGFLAGRAAAQAVCPAPVEPTRRASTARNRRRNATAHPGILSNTSNSYNDPHRGSAFLGITRRGSVSGR